MFSAFFALVTVAFFVSIAASVAVSIATLHAPA
jgi:hypothetical protein